MIKVVSQQDSLSSRWSLISVVFHQGGLSSGRPLTRWSLVRMVFHQSSLSSGWSLMKAVPHQGGLWRRWSLIRMFFHQVVSHQDGLSSGWSLIQVVFDQGGPSSGWSFVHQRSLSSMWSYQGGLSSRVPPSLCLTSSYCRPALIREPVLLSLSIIGSGYQQTKKQPNITPSQP